MARRAAHRPAGGDHRLRRDAVPQVGRAADDVALDHRDLGAEAGGSGGGGVAGRSAADDHESSAHQASAHDHAVAGEERVDARPPARVECEVAAGRSGRSATDTRADLGARPTHSKCMPSGVRKLPPQAKPCLRKICTVVHPPGRVAKSGGAHPWQEPCVLVSSAMPQECRDRNPSELSGVKRLNRAEVTSAVGVGVADVDRAAEAGRQRPRRAPRAGRVR